jgi:hypothetical protein
VPLASSVGSPRRTPKAPTSVGFSIACDYSATNVRTHARNSPQLNFLAAERRQTSG